MANNEGNTDKISAAFRTRIAGLKPQDKVRAVVLLRTNNSARDKAPSRGNRQAIIYETRKSAADALPYVDKVLDKFGGRRLADSVSALGSIPIEATSQGIKVLAELEQVKAILEDQPVSSLPRLKQA